MKQSILAAVFAWLIGGALHAEVITQESYLEQVKKNHLGLVASAGLREAAKSKAEESLMPEQPYAFGQAQLGVNKKETANVGFMGDRTDSRGGAFGVGQTLDFGLKAKVGYNIAYAKTSGTNPMFVSPEGNYDTGPFIELVQPLGRNFMGHETSLMKKLAGIQAEGVDLAEGFKTKMVMIEAEFHYVRLALAREIVLIRAANLGRADRLTKWNRTRVGAGLSDKADLFQSEALLKSREIELQQAREEQRAAARAFNAARGVHSDEVDGTLTKLDAAAISALELPQVSDFDRGDLMALKKQVEIASVQSEVVSEKYRPVIDIFTNLSLNGRDTAELSAFTESLSLKHPSVILGVQINAPLGGDVQKRAISGYLAESQAMDFQAKQREFDLKQDWLNYLARFRDAKTRYSLAYQLESLQRQRLDHERERNEHGRSTTGQVILAEQDFGTAQLGRLAAQVDVMRLYTESKAFERMKP